MYIYLENALIKFCAKGTSCIPLCLPLALSGLQKTLYCCSILMRFAHVYICVTEKGELGYLGKVHVDKKYLLMVISWNASFVTAVSRFQWNMASYWKHTSFQKDRLVKYSNIHQKERGKVFWKLSFSQKQKACLALICCVWFIYTNKSVKYLLH